MSRPFTELSLQFCCGLPMAVMVNLILYGRLIKGTLPIAIAISCVLWSSEKPNRDWYFKIPTCKCNKSKIP